MSTTRQRRPGVRGRYEALLWRTMDALGVTESIERKVVTAVGIQFLVTVGIFLTQFLISGTAAYVVSGALFLGAAPYVAGVGGKLGTVAFVACLWTYALYGVLDTLDPLGTGVPRGRT